MRPWPDPPLLSDARPAEAAALARPQWGLVCITAGPAVRYRTITRTRCQALEPERRRAVLRDLYRENVQICGRAVAFCRAKGIHLYRLTSALFPQNDDPVAKEVLAEVGPGLAAAGEQARRWGIRIVNHPDQFVVLSSESPRVVQNSIGFLEHQAQVLDWLGLPRSPWAAMILHGGKAGRGEALVEVIRGLPPAVRSRLVLENDEYAYSAAEILAVCRRAGAPMVFDVHHHAVRERLSGYEDASVAAMVRAAAATWPERGWQIVHLSNGAERFADPRHSEYIRVVPREFWALPWVEVEAKGKERAIARLRRRKRPGVV